MGDSDSNTGIQLVSDSDSESVTHPTKRLDNYLNVLTKIFRECEDAWIAHQDEVILDWVVSGLPASLCTRKETGLWINLSLRNCENWVWTNLIQSDCHGFIRTFMWPLSEDMESLEKMLVRFTMLHLPAHTMMQFYVFLNSISVEQHLIPIEEWYVIIDTLGGSIVPDRKMKKRMLKERWIVPIMTTTLY